VYKKTVWFLKRLKKISAKRRTQELLDKGVEGQIEELERLLENSQDRIIELNFKRKRPIGLDYMEMHQDEFLDFMEMLQVEWDPKKQNSKLEMIESEIKLHQINIQYLEEEIKRWMDLFEEQEIPKQQRSKEKSYTPSILYDKPPPKLKKTKTQSIKKKSKKSEALLKICILGKKDVGISPWFMKLNKTSYFLERYLLGAFGLGVKSIKLEDKIFKLQIWFLNPHRRSFERLSKTIFFIGCSAAFLVYDITIPESLSRMPEWINLIREKCGNIPIFLLGNNCEFEELYELSRKQAEDLVIKFNLTGIYKISTSNQINLDLPFQKICEFYFEKFFTK